jgi:hypothetical protein
MIMYILVRNDLDPTYRMVQGMHAVARYAQTYVPSGTIWNGTMVCLAVKNEGELIRWISKIESRGEIVSSFQEPDLNNEYTSIVTITNKVLMFKSLQLADHLP